MIQDTQNAQISLTHNGSNIYIYIYIYIYICNYENNVPSRFSQRRLCRNSYPFTCVVWLQDMYQKCLTSNMAAMYQQFVTVHHACKCMSCQLLIHCSFFANLSYPIVAVTLIVSLWTVNWTGGA